MAATILLSILGALLLGAISPGPSFLLVSRISIAGSRRDGLAAAVGMGFGGAAFGALALLGLSALLSQVEWLYLGLKLLGGAYLIYLGARIWRGATAPLAMPTPEALKPASFLRSFSSAFATQVSNPKTAIVYASIFAALLPPTPPFWMVAVLPPLVFLVETLWYAVVALAFSASGPRSVYLNSKRWIDRAAGAVMGILGAKLITEAATS